MAVSKMRRHALAMRPGLRLDVAVGGYFNAQLDPSMHIDDKLNGQHLEDIVDDTDARTFLEIEKAHILCNWQCKKILCNPCSFVEQEYNYTHELFCIQQTQLV